MKHSRHNAIQELIRAEPIASQDDLRRKLLKRGFDVTQATLSRDIRELRLAKGPGGYVLPSGGPAGEPEDEDLPAIREMLSSFGLRVRQAMNQLVLLTTSGSAQPVALAIDEQNWPEVVGTIAGDDTVLLVCPDKRRATQLRERLERMIA